MLHICIDKVDNAILVGRTDASTDRHEAYKLTLNLLHELHNIPVRLTCSGSRSSSPILLSEVIVPEETLSNACNLLSWTQQVHKDCAP